LALPGRSQAADKEVDLTMSREVVVGRTRVVLLQVSRTTVFTDGADGKAPRATTSLQVVYLMEVLGDKPLGTVFSRVGKEAALVAGTTDPAVRWPDGQTRPARSSLIGPGGLEDYKKRWDVSGPLPKVKAANRTFVNVVAFEDVKVVARKLDLRLPVGVTEDEEHFVLFRNVPLE
jgi:hypothetical protein